MRCHPRERMPMHLRKNNPKHRCTRRRNLEIGRWRLRSDGWQYIVYESAMGNSSKETKAVQHRGIASQQGIRLLLRKSSSWSCFHFWAYCRDLDTLESRSWQRSKKYSGARWNDWSGSVWDARVDTPPSSREGEDSVAWSCRRLCRHMDAGMRASLWECSLWHSAGGTGTAWGPSMGREMLMLPVCAYHLGYFVCKTLLVPWWTFFHCCFALIKGVFSPFAACVHLITAPKLATLLTDLLPKAHYLWVKILCRNLVPSNPSFLKFKQ